MEDGSDLSFAFYWHTARCSKLQRRRDGMGRKVGSDINIHAWVTKTSENLFSGYNRLKKKDSIIVLISSIRELLNIKCTTIY